MSRIANWIRLALLALFLAMLLGNLNITPADCHTDSECALLGGNGDPE